MDADKDVLFVLQDVSILFPDFFHLLLCILDLSIFMSFAGMGKLRSLTADEILVQVYYASKVCRVATIIMNSQNGNAISNVLPKIDNIVVSSRWS